MSNVLKVMFSVMLGLAVAAGVGYNATRWAITDARAQGVQDAAVQAKSATQDAGVSDDQKVAPTAGNALSIPDPTKNPTETYSEARGWFMKGPFQGAVFLVLIVASFVHKRTEPADKDGDGQPDVDTTWRGKTWAISGAVAMIGVPLFGLLAHQLGADWTAVMTSGVGAIGLLMSNLNPTKGSKVAT